MKASHLKQYIIESTLKYLGLLNDSGVNLLLGIAAQESHMGEYLHQINGQALGIYQMEPRTERDIWNNFLYDHHVLNNKIFDLTITAPESCFPAELEGNLYYATAMARCHFLRFKEPLPDANNIEGLATYWKKYYNTEEGKGKIVDFINNYYKFVLEENHELAI